MSYEVPSKSTRVSWSAMLKVRSVLSVPMSMSVLLPLESYVYVVSSVCSTCQDYLSQPLCVTLETEKQEQYYQLI